MEDEMEEKPQWRKGTLAHNGQGGRLTKYRRSAQTQISHGPTPVDARN
jgi:hypothetical protein